MWRTIEEGEAKWQSGQRFVRQTIPHRDSACDKSNLSLGVRARVT